MFPNYPDEVPNLNASLRHVEMDLDAFALCINHAFSSEKEPVMGLLIGTIDADRRKAEVRSAQLLTIVSESSDDPDQVIELTPDHFMEGGKYAAEMTQKWGVPCTVIGWYHSHPKKTVWPTLSDLKRQIYYQYIEPSFFGLILSVYNGQNTIDAMNICCFQTQKVGHRTINRKCIDVTLNHTTLNLYNLEGYLHLSKLLWEEKLKSCANQSREETDYFEQIRHDSLATVQLMNIMDTITKPLFWSLEERLKITKMRIRQLINLKLFLETYQI